MRRAEVFVNIPVKSIAKAYSYAVPDEMSFLAAGWRVFVPFGGRRVEGFVVSVREDERERTGYELKPIISVVDEEAWFTSEMLETARRIADFYLCSPAEAMRLFMPGKSGLKIEVEYEAKEGEESSLTGAAQQVFRCLRENGVMQLSVLRKALPALAAEMPVLLEKLVQQKQVRKLYRA